MIEIDINVDLGEGYPNDQQLLKVATSANVCCGVHAGSHELTLETIQHCIDNIVRIGAHPGYPDPTNFGRTPFVRTNLSLSQIKDSLVDQLEPVLPYISYIKPHGALYNDSTQPGPISELLIEVLSKYGKPLLGLPNTFHEQIAIDAKVQLIKEGFADRAYTPDGRLVPRSQSGAILSSPFQKANQALVIANSVDSICVHGDEPDCVETITTVRHLLEYNGYKVTH